MLSHRALAPLLVLLALTACSSDPKPGPDTDPVGETDAGSTTDGGPRLDAGSDSDAGPIPDAGTDIDAGSIADSGTDIDAGPIADAGTDIDAGPLPDSGTDTDAGSLPDAGTDTDSGTDIDAGPLPDAGTDTDAGPIPDAGTDIDAGTIPDSGTDTDAGTLPDAGHEPLVVTTTSLPQAARGKAYFHSLAASGGIGAVSWSITLGALPDGLQLSASNGDLTGTPTIAGAFDLIVTATDEAARTASRALTLTVTAPTPALLKLGQYNLTYFGSDTQGPPDAQQVEKARDVMLEVGANLWALVEMVDANDFQTLKSQLPRFRGFLSNDPTYVTGSTSPYGATTQKLGILYDSSLSFQSAELLRLGDLNDFANRPPLRVNFRTEIQGTMTPLTVIVVHMRAESADPTGPRAARERASAALKTYLDQNLAGQHVFVVGDWNDDVDESITLDPSTQQPMPTPYQNFVSDPEHYTFITRELSLDGEATSIGFENVVDHTLASAPLAARYVAGSAEVIHADEWVPDYLETLSDHRPVASSYALSSVTQPFIRIEEPAGGPNPHLPGSPLEVLWHAYGVNLVHLDVSMDGGATWARAELFISAALGRTTWTLPSTATSDLRVRLVDTSDSSLFDVNDAPIVVAQPSGRVIINEVLANEPAINNTNNVAYEFVELVNVGGGPVDLSGWSISDAALARHVFPAGTTLAAGKAIVVFGGAAGIPPGRTNAVAASTGALGLSNDSDTVSVRRQDASLVDQYAYTSTVDNVSDNRSPDADPNVTTFKRHNVVSPTGLTSSPGLRADGTAF
ncbi:lamin tail domain-containing protein [Myxococcus sp. K38C18041901]|uniref:lamin tail domain-containing protein n=1 Tax=Myxococcus guangdongensis TaxID=2906760 RepID=UPI0020A72C3D|nr:lamin tail domain-containing protein [Myxococcus guangdongensis]MCP3062314.1 lamin tail domain-containing protein [Myxococcus guangdongensis]